MTKFIIAGTVGLTLILAAPVHAAQLCHFGNLASNRNCCYRYCTDMAVRWLWTKPQYDACIQTCTKN